jgi:hypothetical protein
MYLFKKLTLTALAVVFCLGLFAVTTNAQYGRNRGWSNSGIYIQYGQPQWNRRSRITPQEYRRLQRERYRIYRSTNRSYRDGYISEQERRRLERQRDRYRRHVYRDRRDW